MPTNKAAKRDRAERDARGKQPAPERLPPSPNRTRERDAPQRQEEKRIERFRER